MDMEHNCPNVAPLNTATHFGKRPTTNYPQAVILGKLTLNITLHTLHSTSCVYTVTGIVSLAT